ASSPASILAVPVTIRGAASGALTFLMTESGRRFDEADVRLAQELARRVAVAIDNGRLYADEQRARRQAERTTDRLARSQALTTALSEAVTVDEVAAVVVDQGLATAGAASAALALLNGDGAALEIVAAAGDPAIALAPAGPRIPLDRPGLYADAIRSARPVFLGSARDLRERRPALADAIDPAAAGAVAIVSLVAERRALGAIGLTFAEAQPFADDQTALLHAYARQSTQAIERARLYAAEQAARADAEATRSRLAFLADASAALAASLDIDATLQRLGELLVPALADWCAIHIVRDDGAVEQLVVAHADPAKVAWARALQERYPYDPNTPTGVPQVLRAGASELYPEITDELLAASTEDPEQLALARSLGFASAMIVPLIAHGAIFGAITLVTAESGRHYDDDDLRFAEDVARRAAIAVSNARHYQAEERARHEAERANIRKTQLQTITAALAGALTLDDVARAVVDASVGALGAVAGSVSLQTEGDDVYRVVYAQGYDGERVEPWRTFTPETPIPLAAAIRDRTPILLGSAAEVAARYPNLNIMAGQPSSHSVAAIPLVFEDRALGALGLSFAEEQSFTADDLAFLVALARQSAVALERARLYDAERLARDKAQAAEHLARRGAERITAFANVSRAIAEAGFDVQAALDAVAQIIAAAMDDYVVIQLLSDDGGWIDVRAIADGDPHHQHPDRQQARSSRQDAHHGFSAHVIETGAPLIVNDVPRERDETLAPPVSWERLAAAQIRSLLVVPLRARERRIGTMTLMRTRAGEPYTASDVGFTQELADRAALAIDNARLYGAARDAVRARDEFLSIAAHELRTPVTTVKGYAQLLRRAEERDGLTSRRARQFIRAIESSSDRLRLLADDLLDVSRLRLGRMPLRPARVALGEVAAATIERLREQLGAADRIVVEQAPDVPDVDADPDRIDQILSNLLDNAAKYSPPTAPVTLRLEPSDGGVLISVRDEGIGLPVDELEPIFEPFQRASNAERENLPG
ncbi:MAG TPA: GAF domain-containing protein, partial [Thermomicrobiales bacterium]|nr:GAF domain-containing protein [Thermomicrobiales bacterium]